MQTLVDWFRNIPPDIMGRVVRIAVVLVGGLLIARVLLLLSRRAVKKASEHTKLLVKNAIVYGCSILVFMGVLGEFGFNFTTLLGAAGIVGIAVGFASQTSVSNIISGLFLVSEKPFTIGDVIRVGNTTGIILAIDLLSIKIRTFDNLFVRIPNETILKTEVVNITRFPIRRLDLMISVAFKEDIARVRDLLLDIARRNHYCLNEPEPLVLFQNFGNSGMEFLFAVWFLKSDFVNLRNSIAQEIKERFDAEGIEIPFPHRTLYSGEASRPLPIRIVNEACFPGAAAEPTAKPAAEPTAKPMPEPTAGAAPKGKAPRGSAASRKAASAGKRARSRKRMGL